LVFSQFVDFLSLLRAPLDAAGIAYQYLDGATPAAERTKRVAAFQAGEGDLFLISLKAGGFGLNLTAADYVVITDPWWNPAAEDQAMGRAHRMGQLRPVTVYRLVTKGTIEERIVDLHHDKRALAEGVLSGEETTALPSTDDLIALMRGLRAAPCRRSALHLRHRQGHCAGRLFQLAVARRGGPLDGLGIGATSVAAGGDPVCPGHGRGRAWPGREPAQRLVARP
jgi:superfamily II DNA or RNA helicase